MAEIKNIYQRMLAATNDIQTVAKNLNVEIVKGKGYKAVGEIDILNAVKPVEAKHGIYSYPYQREIISTEKLEKETQYGTKVEFMVRIATTYRFVNIDKPDEYIDVKSYADGIDSGDKATGKAMTYSDKYALMKAYKISTGDDPDQEASPNRIVKETMATAEQEQELKSLMTEERFNLMLSNCGVKSVMEMPQKTAAEFIRKLKKQKETKA